MSETENKPADQTVVIGDETITVREFRYREGIEAAALAQPLLNGLRSLFTDAGGQMIEPEALDTLIGQHGEIWLQLIAKASGRDVEWIAALPDHEAFKLHLAFWTANGAFFTRRIFFSSAFAAAVKQRRAPSAPTA